MGEGKSLYVCCSICSKPIARSKRCDGIEVTCSKCGSRLRIVVDPTSRVSVEIVKDKTFEKVNNSVAPRNVGLGLNR